MNMNFRLIKGKTHDGFILLELIIVLLIVSVLISAFYFSNGNIIKNLLKLNKNEEDNINVSSLCMYVGKFVRRANLVYKHSGSDTIIFRRKENNINTYYFFEKKSKNIILRSLNDTTKVKDDPNRWKTLKESTIRKNSYNLIATDIDSFDISIEDNSVVIKASSRNEEAKDIVRILRYEEN